MTESNGTGTAPMKIEQSSGLSPSFTFSQELRFSLSQELRDSPKYGEFLGRLGQSFYNDSAYMDNNYLLRNSQQELYRCQSLEISASQQTVELSQGSSKEEMSRGDSLYQGLVQNLHPNPSQSIGLLFDPQIQSCSGELKSESTKSQSITTRKDLKSVDKVKTPKIVTTTTVTTTTNPTTVKTTTVVTTTPTPKQQKGKNVVLLTLGRQQIVRLGNITIRRVKRKHRKKGSLLFQV